MAAGAGPRWAKMARSIARRIFTLNRNPQTSPSCEACRRLHGDGARDGADVLTSLPCSLTSAMDLRRAPSLEKPRGVAGLASSMQMDGQERIKAPSRCSRKSPPDQLDVSCLKADSDKS